MEAERKDHPADKPLIEFGSALARAGVKFQAKRRMNRAPHQGEIEYIQVFQTYPVVNVAVHAMPKTMIHEPESR